jgi:hypothetical protein
MASSTLEEVAAAISADVKIVSDLLRERGEAPPTFSEEGAVVIELDESEDDKTATLLQARNRLINAANDLLQLARGPVDHVASLGYGVCRPAEIHIFTTTTMMRRHDNHSNLSLGHRYS